VIIRAGIAGTLAPSSTPTARLLNQGGVALVDLPLVRRPDGQYEASLPIASLARGEYLVEFSAVSGGALAQALVPLRVK
jgi:hypothetical protein